MSRPEQLSRRRSRNASATRVIALVSVCSLAVVGLGLGLVREAHNPLFAIGPVNVSGTVHTSTNAVLAAAALPQGRNAWLVNRRAAEHRVEALPWVARALIATRWPNRLTISVTERVPTARVVLAPASDEEPVPRYALIDDNQRILEIADDPKAFGVVPELVVVPAPGDVGTGTELDRRDVGQALDAYRRLSALGLHVSQVAIAPSTGMSATADRNLRVLFGEDEDLARKAQLFQAIVAKISTPSRIAYVDVRSVRAPTVLYR